MHRIIVISLLASGTGYAASSPIFPAPKQFESTEGTFVLSGSAIVVPAQPSQDDLKLARFLTQELSDRWDVQLPTRREANWPAESRVIVMGSITNPLVQEYCRRQHIDVTASSPGPEGYVLHVSPNAILIAGSDERGAFYGVQSLRQLIARQGSRVEAMGAHVRDWPYKPFRGITLYLPGHANIAFFHRFVRDFMALYKFNEMTVEMDGSMRLDQHPEINAGWVEMCRDTNYARRNYPPSPAHDMWQNASHQDVADGEIIEKSEVAELVEWARENNIEVIPEIPSLTHSYYLLTRHKELSELAGHKWPDTFCPLNPGSYKLIFDVLDEYIDVIKPKMVHIGHDEWFTPIDECPRCKGRDTGELYGEDVKKTVEFLASRGVRAAMWGDMLLEGARGKGPAPATSPSGWKYRGPGAMRPEQVKKWISQDILVFNWFWAGPEGRANEDQLERFGMKQIYGNMEPDIPDLQERVGRKSIIGGAPSAWEATAPVNFGKDMVYSFLGCENVLWAGRVLPHPELRALVQSRMRETRHGFQGLPMPSETDPVSMLDISPAFNMSTKEASFEVDLSGLKEGNLTAGKLAFDLKKAGEKVAVIAAVEGKQGNNPLPHKKTIPIGVDATSLIFLHASALAATNKIAYRLMWDQEETADLLGYYEIVYEDGFVTTLPIRYGLNILEWNWSHTKLPPVPGSPEYHTIGGSDCYLGDLVILGQNQQGPVTFFAYEWQNPRLGRVIKEVRLIGTTGFHSAVPGFENNFGDVISNNAILLKAISYVRAR